MYIDGVFSGGGIKGFALIGAYQAIESKGIKFKRVAGTSAGSILSAFISAGYTSSEIIELMTEIDLTTFLDARKRKLLPDNIINWFFLFWKMGLYRGDVLEEWVATKLAAKGIYTFGDLPPQTLRFIASDLTNGRILILPEGLKEYGINPETFPIAKAVRMSCCLPYIFEPVQLKTQNRRSIVVDGAVLSNFPMWLFDTENVVNKRPVLGIKFTSTNQDAIEHKIKNAIGLFGALFETMMTAHDSRYISRKHVKNIVFIPTDSNLTTEFSLSNEKKLELIKLGKTKTEDFLKKWCY